MIVSKHKKIQTSQHQVLKARRRIKIRQVKKHPNNSRQLMPNPMPIVKPARKIRKNRQVLLKLLKKRLPRMPNKIRVRTRLQLKNQKQKVRIARQHLNLPLLRSKRNKKSILKVKRVMKKMKMMTTMMMMFNSKLIKTDQRQVCSYHRNLSIVFSSPRSKTLNLQVNPSVKSS